MSSTDLPRLLILADHPSLHRGFATVGREIAGHLHQKDTWQVTVIGYYPPEPNWQSPGYRVIALDDVDTPRSARQPRLEQMLPAILESGAHLPTLLLCIGTDFDLGAVANALEVIAWRKRVTLVGYSPIDYAPLPTAAMDAFARYDHLVPYTTFAQEALVDCAQRAGVDLSFIADPIPHGVDSSRFKPLDENERQIARRDLFNLHHNELLVGYFGRNSRNKRIDIVMHLFAMAVNGHYAVCANCGVTNAGHLDKNGIPTSIPTSCNACAHKALTPAAARQDAWLYLHADLDGYRYAASGGRNLRALARALDIEHRVIFRDDIQIGYGDPTELLVARMSACDVHVLPFHHAGWELTVLETGACAVANIITEAFSPPEYASPFSLLVPVGSYVLSRDVQALIDLDLGLAALTSLLDQPARRAALAAQGPVVARQLDWRGIAERWNQRLLSFL